MKPFYKRTLTGIFYVLFILICLISGPLTYYILFTGFLIIGILELYKAYGDETPLQWKVSNIIVACLFFTTCFFDAAQIINVPFSMLLSLLILVIFISKLFVAQTDLTKQTGRQFFIYFYLALPLALSNYIVFKPEQQYFYDYHILLNIFVLLWCNDSGAYIAGSSLGKHPFFNKISPKKTWEGFVGGVIITMTAAYIISLFNNHLTTGQWLITGGIIGVFGTFGDLIESLIKRNANIKDSGNLFPGHGGLLDRIDSLLISLLTVFVYLKYINII